MKWFTYTFDILQIIVVKQQFLTSLNRFILLILSIHTHNLSTELWYVQIASCLCTSSGLKMSKTCLLQESILVPIQKAGIPKKCLLLIN